MALIGAGVAIGVLRPWQTPQSDLAERAPIVVRSPVAAPQPAAPVPQIVPPLPSKPQESIASVPAAPAPEIANAPKAEPKPIARPKRRIDRPVRKAETPVVNNTETEPVPESRAETPAAEPINAEPVGTMSDLPPAIRDELPKIKITVHAYSGKRASRLVGYDNRILREGDYLVPGLKLEEITQDGMILSYKGYRFSRGAN